MTSILIDPSDERRILDFRLLGFRDVAVLGRYRYASVHKALTPHAHNGMMEICCLERGEQTYYVGQQRFDLIGGDVFLTFPDETHGTGPSPEGKGVLFWMLVQMPGKNRPFFSLPSAQARPLIDALLTIPLRHFPAGENLFAILHRVFETFDRSDDPLRTVELQNLLLRFCLDLLKASKTSERQISPEIVSIQDFIAENVGAWPTVGQLARRAGLSEPRFKTRFKKEVGIPPADYMMRRRIEAAQSLLKSGCYCITDVAMQLGFSTSHYFASAFKRYTGTTPSQFRKQHCLCDDAAKAIAR